MEVRNYNLEFDIDIEDKIFRGREEIEVFLDEEKESLEIDAIDLKINDVKIFNEKIDYEVLQDKIILKNRFKKGDYKIFINFEGELKEVLGGLYLSRYDQNKYLVTTQFEPVEARKAFPCFDHPAYKAVFNLTLIIDKNLKAISNTLPVKEAIIGDKKKIVFASTPKMSTYLLYIGVGDFEFLEDRYKDILIRVVTTPGKSQGGYFALDCAKKFLSYLEDYFDYPYPLKKLDLIAISDFAAGAMENWGAITFRENLLLYFEGITPLQAKVRIAEVIAHELVHMWFGNLVTMKWWDDLWLNESFATYLAYKAVNNSYPEWEVMKEYVASEVISGLSVDALLSSHPVKVEVKNIEESTEIFDEISYEKGGSVLRMIENYLGEEKFKEGLRFYIKNYAYQNATSDDLWKCLEETGEEVVSIMNNFISQTGFPVVFLKKDKEYFLEQKRFTFLPNEEKEIWKIPMVIEIDNQLNRLILNNSSQNLPFPNFSYLILNKNYSGFYLVNYPEEILEKNLKKVLEANNELDLLHFVNDYYFLLKSNYKNLNNYLNFLEKLAKIQQKFVLVEILDQLKFLYYLFEDERIKTYLEIFATQALNFLGLEPKDDEKPIESTLRNLSLASLALIENKDILNFIESKFPEALVGKIHPDLKQVIFVYGINLKKENYKKLYDYYLNANIFEEQAKILSAFGNLYDLNLLNEALEFLFSEKVRFNQFVYLFTTLATNLKFKNFAFNWFIQNWQRIEEKGGGPGKSDFVLLRLLKTIVPTTGVFIEKQKLKDFFAQENLQRFPKTVKILLEKVEINRNFYENYKK